MMSEITPRWEWRTFGTRFARAEAVFAALETKGEQVDLVGLLHTRPFQPAEQGLSAREARAEGAPLPPWRDRGHR